MFQDLLRLLPEVLPDPGTSGAWMLPLEMILGVVLLVLGSRLSRWLVTLALVAGGTGLGLILPRRLGWTVDAMGPAIVAALVAGVLGYVLHRVWLGLGLGLVAAGWAAVLVWTWLAHGATWRCPTFGTDGGMVAGALDYAQALWTSIPSSANRVLPFACAAALVSGAAVALLWPRVCAVLFYTLSGTALLVIAFLHVVQLGGARWIDWLPQRTGVQFIPVGGLLLLGLAVQWWLMPKGAGGTSAKKSETAKAQAGSKPPDDS